MNDRKRCIFRCWCRNHSDSLENEPEKLPSVPLGAYEQYQARLDELIFKWAVEAAMKAKQKTIYNCPHCNSTNLVVISILSDTNKCYGCKHCGGLVTEKYLIKHQNGG